eukprot:TRINITY_DN560_c0_g3_i1.p1 TRINITY_DN560_c0_g3~~TRINITY_DN560_c0_g3_i1.p1  ORF type:complete len:355 (+),score=130.39 TRINITY_DN560_c0_g3_i1:129-1067(+)
MVDIGNELKGIQQNLKYGVSDAQGKRESMEDAFYINLDLKPSESEDDRSVAFFGVYDGHGGSFCSKYISENLHKHIIEHEKIFEDPLEAMKYGVLKTEEDFIEHAQENQLSDGSTIVMCIIIENELYVANVGDSELIVSHRGRGIAVSEIHNPSKNENEITRVEACGGRLHGKRVGHPYLNPSYFHLGVSRAIGDIMYKSDKMTQGKPSGIVADPYLAKVTLDFNEHSLIIIACDGLWDVMEYQEAVNFAAEELEDFTPQEVCEHIVDEALRRGSEDNVTAIILTWQDFADSDVESSEDDEDEDDDEDFNNE